MATDQYRGDKLLDAAGVNADLARKVKAVLADVRGHGKQIMITQVKRSMRQQRAYYAKGRTDTQLRNRGYTKEQIAVARADGGKSTDHQVTWSLKSKHIQGLAADLVPIRNGAPDWSDSETYALMVKSAVSHGLVAGARWKVKDTPHVQLGE